MSLLRRYRLLCWVPPVLAVHLLLLWIYHYPVPKQLWGDEILYWRAANSLVAGRPAELDLLWPPLYPHFLALLLRLGGGSLLLVQLVQTGLLVLVAWLARDLWRRLVRPGPVAEMVALAFVAYPPLVAFAHYLWPEVLHLALFVAAIWILALHRRSARWLVLLGLLLGLALLTKSLLGPFLPIFIFPVLLGVGWRKGIPRALLVLLVLGVTVAPAVFVNYQLSGSAVIADSSRFNLWVGLNDSSRKNFVDEIASGEYTRYMASAESAGRRNEILETKIGRLVDERGFFGLIKGQLGKQYFRLLDKDSFLTDQLPGGAIAAHGSGYRETPTLAALLLSSFSYGAYGLLLVGAVAGISLVPPAGRRWIWWMLGFLIYNLALFFLMHVKSRYRIQLLPCLFLYAGLAGEHLLDRLKGAAPTAAGTLRTSRVALAAALVSLALVLFLAYGRPLS